jgi:hypothetical protein
MRRFQKSIAFKKIKKYSSQPITSTNQAMYCVRHSLYGVESWEIARKIKCQNFNTIKFYSSFSALTTIFVIKDYTVISLYE